MIVFGFLSSIFDDIVFGLLVFVFNVKEDLFHTVWFAESVISAVSLMLILRTSKPIFKSKPSKTLLLSAALIILITATLSYLPINRYIGFVSIPGYIWPWVIGIVAVYILLGELIKGIFYKYNKL